MRKFINLDSKTKKILRLFAIFFGMIFGMTVLLVVVSLVSRNSWRAGLAVEVQSVLDDYPSGQFTVGKSLVLNSNLSASCAVYTLIKKDERKNGKYYGVIVRIPSILGPLPAVFICKDGKDVVFAGYAIDNGKAEVTSGKQMSSSIMNYWEGMIPKIIAKSRAD